MELPLPSQSYQTRSKPLSSQRLVNLYCEVYKDDSGVLRTKSLIGTPGLIENIDFELTTPIYGASFFKNKIVFCIKNKVFEYDKDIEPKINTVYNWENFSQPVMYSNNTYGMMSDSKHTNNTYKITETSTMVGGVYPDEQGITLETAPNYFVKSSELPYIVKWKFDNVIKITALSIKTRLLPQNFISARFYLDEEMTTPLGAIFNNNGNDGVATITVSDIPAEGVETDVIYLAILSMDKNSNSSCVLTGSSYWSWDLTENNVSNAPNILNQEKAILFNNKYFLVDMRSSSNIDVYNSTDGTSWSYSTIDTVSPNRAKTNISCSDTLMFFCLNNHSKYYTTTDGSTWTTRTNLPASVTIDGNIYTNYNCQRAFYINGYYLIYCQCGSSGDYKNFFLYSTNGTSWSMNTAEFLSTTTSGSITWKDIDYYNGEYYSVYIRSQNITNPGIFVQKTLNPYNLSTIVEEKNITTENRNALFIKINPNTENVYIGTNIGTYLIDINLSSFDLINNIPSSFGIISPINSNSMFIAGSLGIYNIENDEQISSTSINFGLYSSLSNTFTALGKEIKVSGVYTEKTDIIPYIKLDDLSITGEVQGTPIVTYTRKYRQLGIIEDLSSYVDMVDDGDHLFILHSNGKGYYVEENLDGELELKQVQDDLDEGWEYQKLKSVCYLAGRFVGVDYSAGTIRWTEILNPNGWSVLNYIQSETSINELTAIRSNTREAWVFSPKNIEVYTPTGSSDSPSAFARVPGAYIDKGCKYKNCIAMNQNMFYWVATDGCVYRNAGYNAERISTVALENEIMNYGEQEDILGQIYTQAGHTFYIIKFKTSKKTWCYDITTGLWHERESNDGEWKGDLVISAWHHTYVSDKDKSVLYDLSLDVGTDNGDVIKREFVFPTIKNEELRTFHRRLEIDMDTGFSNKENLFLQYSDDGGYTWSNEYWVNLGEKAEYNRKLEWRRLGSSITRIYRIKMSTINKVNVIGAYIDIKKGIA